MEGRKDMKEMIKEGMEGNEKNYKAGNEKECTTLKPQARWKDGRT